MLNLSKKKNNSIQTSGKRKTAIARATLNKGKGIVKINNVPLDLITPKLYKMRMEEPLILSGDVRSKIDLMISVQGGGMMAQADATRTAIAKALVEHTPDLKSAFNDYDRHLLVADVRLKETSKPNRHGSARSKKQKSYR